ncbi:hypothetical protein, partial [Pectobacterium versatile]|uniref:hypothetical protein n=1 Tax=Pectobacterium versatile TaxID=2488639 RepID=UPI001F2F44DA
FLLWEIFGVCCLYLTCGKRQSVSCVDRVDYVISELDLLAVHLLRYIRQITMTVMEDEDVF